MLAIATKKNRKKQRRKMMKNLEPSKKRTIKFVVIFID
jgi:hypothetical protein